MSAANFPLTIEKGVDFSISMILQRANGDYVDLSDTGTCIRADIVEFYGIPPITGFTIAEILPSGVSLSLDEGGTLVLAEPSYYTVVLNTNGVTERLVEGIISTSETATINTFCS